MEAIGTLAGGIAHDFNNILGGIFGYVELMLEDAEEGSYLQDDLGEMMKACMRGKELVQQILTFSRQEQPQRKPAQLQPIIKESLKLLRATIPTTIDIQSEIDPDLGPVVIDPTQIHQVMMNLCTNAYHAMRNTGGCLQVSLKKVDYQGQIANIANALPFGCYAALRVEDTGEGMDEATRQRIYDPFFTTKRLGEGTGMGLSVVHGIVQNHEGLITVESVLGHGSVFIVYLPLKGVAAVDGERDEQPSEMGVERIFLVDDDAFLRNVQQRLLARQGYHVRLFTNGLEALEAFEDDPYGVDLVISDQTMPKMSGMEMAKVMLRRRGELPIILTTGYSDVIQPEDVTQMGVREMLMKPVPKQMMLAAIRRHLS
ncbi:hybrid sensor histidine kinase/response regulator [Acanthopleuribacter pedis]